MSKLDDGFERALEVEQGEVLSWYGPAMHRVGSTWVGGRVYVSNRRLFFCPGVVSRGRYGILRILRSSIANVELRGRDMGVSAGGLRRRVVIRTTAGDEHIFTLLRFTKRSAELLAQLQPGAGES